MILKKPYAFLIKHFKIINLILAILTSYLAYRIYIIIRFFNEYIKSNYLGSFYTGFYQDYISFFMYFVVILIIIGLLLILLLFIYKKKPIKVYAMSIFYYIFILVSLIYIKNTMVAMETTVISAQLSRVLRDIAVISLIPQIVFIVLFVIRGFGVNISKFNFESDLKDLAISEEDNAEVEITFKNDGTKLKRTVRRFIREFSYYIKENKYIVIALIVGVVLIAGYFGFRAVPEQIDETYREGDTFNVSGLNYSVLDSIVTNMDYAGNYLGKNVYYVVVKIKIENPSDYNYDIDFKNFRLELNNEYFYPVQDQGGKFIDFAQSYSNTLIRRNSEIEFSLVYKISLAELKKNYTIRIDSGTSRELYVKIYPDVIENIETVGTYKLAEEVNFQDSNLGNTTLKLDNPQINAKYVYNYEYCKDGNCTTYKDQVYVTKGSRVSTLLALDYEFNLDKEAPYSLYSQSINKFIENFAKLKYLDGSKMVYTTVSNVTPNNLKGQIVLEVTSKLYATKEAYLAIIIRNKEYLIKIV